MNADSDSEDDADNEVTSAERKSDNNEEFEATSSKVTKHAESEDEVTLSRQKTVVDTKYLTISSKSANEVPDKSVVRDASLIEDEVTSYVTLLRARKIVHGQSECKNMVDIFLLHFLLLSDKHISTMMWLKEVLLLWNQYLNMLLIQRTCCS